MSENAWVEDERYSRVDTVKLLDAADKIERAVEKMLTALENMEAAYTKYGTTGSGDTRTEQWGGEAGDRWCREYEKVRGRLTRRIEGFQDYPKYIRDRVGVYVKAAIDAEVTGQEAEEDVRKLLEPLLELTGGSGLVSAIHATTKISKVEQEDPHV